MNSTQLACFIEVAQHLNFAKAAQNLHLSQPTVSKQIQSLENELGVRLFERSTRSVSLTYAGRRFFPDARGILIQEQKAVKNLRDMERCADQPLIIGSYGMELFSYLAEILSPMLREMPNLRPDIINAPYQSLRNALVSHSMDIVIGTKQLLDARQGNGESSFEKLADAPVRCILPQAGGEQTAGVSLSGVSPPGVFRSPDEKERKEDDIVLTADDLEPEKMKQRFGTACRLTFADLESALRNQSCFAAVESVFSSRYTVFCDNAEAAFCLVKAGAGFLLMPEPDLLRRRDLRYLSVESAPVFSYGYFYEKKNRNPALKKFRLLLKKCFESG